MALWFGILALIAGGDALSLRRSSSEVAQKSCQLEAGVYYDGYSRVACEVDVTPPEHRLYFKEHACVGMPAGSSCRLQTLGMTPSLCFDFCRQHKDMKFFGIEYGRDCYCGVYFHPKSTGGQGTCNLPCEGNSKEMCGGKDKSSLFEMHWCDASAGRVKMVKGMAEEAFEKSGKPAKYAKQTFEEIQSFAAVFPSTLGVCSIEPQGKLVCASHDKNIENGNSLNLAYNEVAKAEDVLDKAEKTLDDVTAKIEEAGDDVSGELAGKGDKAVEAVKDAVVALNSASASAEATLKRFAGPLQASGKDAMENFKDHFEELGNVKENWHGVCALEPIKGQSYVGMGDGEAEAGCAKKCFSLVTGTDSCVGFNYQQLDGVLDSCQLLTDRGLTKPALSKAVPIFEVSKTKVDAMKMTALSCWMKKATMGSHPAGPLNVDVVKKVTVDR